MEKVETLNKAESGEKSTKISSKKKDIEISALVLDTPLNKYDMVLLARRWAQELKSKEGESRSLHELINVAIQDILSGDVSHKMVRDLPTLRIIKKQKGTDLSHVLNQIPSSSKKDS